MPSGIFIYAMILKKAIILFFANTLWANVFAQLDEFFSMDSARAIVTFGEIPDYLHADLYFLSLADYHDVSWRSKCSDGTLNPPDFILTMVSPPMSCNEMIESWTSYSPKYKRAAARTFNADSLKSKFPEGFELFTVVDHCLYQQSGADFEGFKGAFTETSTGVEGFQGYFMSDIERKPHEGCGYYRWRYLIHDLRLEDEPMVEDIDLRGLPQLHDPDTLKLSWGNRPHLRCDLEKKTGLVSESLVIVDPFLGPENGEVSPLPQPLWLAANNPNKDFGIGRDVGECRDGGSTRAIHRQITVVPESPQGLTEVCKTIHPDDSDRLFSLEKAMARLEIENPNGYQIFSIYQQLTCPDRTLEPEWLYYYVDSGNDGSVNFCNFPVSGP